MSYIKRDIEAQLIDKLKQPKALFILGARQVGKTTLLKRLCDLVGKEHSLFYDIKFPANLELFSGSLENLLARWRFERPNSSGLCYVFIDEIQYVADFSKKVKLLTDHYSDEFKLVMSGSSSALIKYQFSESLVGRKEIISLYPLSFLEFCRFKGEEKIAAALEEHPFGREHPLLLIPEKMQTLLDEYIIYGGFPDVVLRSSHRQKTELLYEIVSSYILKDIKSLFKIDKTEQINRLIRYLAANIGKELNLSSISISIGLHRDTLQKYLEVLQESFIIALLRPFHQNLDKELRKMPKVYLLDTGLRNSLVNNLSPLNTHPDQGALVENAFFNGLFYRKTVNQSLHYWKTKSGQEIDFILKENDLLTAFEVKFGNSQAKHWTAFKNSYHQARCQTVRFSYRNEHGSVPLWG